MELNGLIIDKSINISLVIVMFLVIVILGLWLKLFKNTLRRYTKKYIIKVVFFLFLTILSFSLIISSVIFFYKTSMIRMLIPSCMGTVLLAVDAIVYVMFFDNKGGY